MKKLSKKGERITDELVRMMEWDCQRCGQSNWHEY